MELSKKQPLRASNIPKLSHLPLRTVVARKRTITEAAGPSASEGAPPSKRIAQPTNKPVLTTSKACKPAGQKSKPVKYTVRPVTRPTATKPATTSVGSNKFQPVKVPGGLVAGKKQKKESDNKSLTQILNEVEILSSRMTKLEAEKTEGQGAATSQQRYNEITSLLEQIKTLEDQLSQTRRELSDTKHHLELTERSKVSLQRAHDDVEVSLASARQEIASLKTTVSQMVADASTMQCQLEAVKATRDLALQESQSKSETISELQQERDGLSAALQQCWQRIREDESHRRKLHNVIQELKGNIRVFCRVRPLLSSEHSTRGLDDSIASADIPSSMCSVNSSVSQGPVRGDKGNLHIDFPDKDRDGKKVTLHFSPAKEDGSTRRSSRNQQYEFEYDHVFGPECTQEAVFSEISQLVQSALDGYHVCIFAYGQTGSGKTYTMEGPSGCDVESQGMIPRALQQVFTAAQDLKEKGWIYKMEASFIEIYNETLRDLLSTGQKDMKHEIRLDSKKQGMVYVTNLTPVVISSQQQVTRLLEVAVKNRAVAATDCNERSSRSHCLFRLTLSGTNHKSKETCSGSLNLVDLAGSERLSSSGSAGDRLKETQSINKSLSNLGNVIMALANKEQHIPYRNSKLTYLLQSSLGGNSKTLMFVNLSPMPTALQETLCSLRFASKVNQCNIGTARKVIK